MRRQVFLIFSVSTILFSSCGVGSHGSVAFSKRKYTSGHFSDPIAKANPVIPVKKYTGQPIETNISKPMQTIPVVGTKVTPQPGNGSGILNHISSYVNEVSSHTILKKIFPDNVKTENPGDMPEHGNKDSQAAPTTNYGLAGLLLTVLSPLAFVLGLFIVVIGSGSSFWGGNFNNNLVDWGIVLIVAGSAGFILGFIFDIMGAKERDKHEEAAILGLALIGLLVIVVIINLL